jgi:ribose/xylose/arabinose/galactoside ABC-type transport system permease subunit
VTAVEIPASAPRSGPWIPVKIVPILASATLFAAMFTVGSFRYADQGFFSGQIVLNLFIDNSFLLVVAVGMTFVILTGGIDLSVGSQVSLATLICAELSKAGWSPWAAFAAALLVGSTLGFGMGCIIHYFEIQPFIVTLAGMFFARGLCYAITVDAISITDPSYAKLGEWYWSLPFGLNVTLAALIAMGVTLIGIYVLHLTRLGRNVYAVGGGQQSALLMGLPLARTKVAVYTISGFCSALGGILWTFYQLSGSGSLAVGLELDAIAAVVIGGTLLMGGTGYLVGSLIGVLVLGLIKTMLNFEGTLSSWWAKIVTAVLVFAFILLQRLVFRAQRR